MAAAAPLEQNDKEKSDSVAGAADAGDSAYDLAMTAYRAGRYAEAERRFDNTPRPQPMLDEYIDMSPLGRSDRGQLREMAVTITAPPRPGPSGRRAQTSAALVYMAQQFGFLDATTDHF